MPITNAALAQQVSELVNYWKLRDTEYATWLAGTATGGPYGDGRYPLTNYLYQTIYVKCPAALQAAVTGAVDSAESYADDAAVARAAALAAQAAASSAVTTANTASSNATAAAATAVNAQTYAQAADASAASSLAQVTTLVNSLSLGQIPYKNLNENISGAWNFLARPTVNGVNVVLASEIPDLGSAVTSARQVNTSGSLTGGGDLSANRTLSLDGDEAAPGNDKVYSTSAAGAKGWRDGVFAARQIATQYSLEGGGTLAADRTLRLVGDVATPGASQFYGTDGAGNRGWYAQVAYVPLTRTVQGTDSITGGGTLNANLTLSLVNDATAPGNNMVYGTDGSGVKGWYAQYTLPANVALLDAAANFTAGLQTAGVEVGYRKVPKSATTSGTLTAAESGKCVPATGGITIDGSVFAAGDAVSIYNDSGSSITITQGSGMTLRLAGADTTGNRTLAQRGIATLWFNSATEAVISGGGLT